MTDKDEIGASLFSRTLDIMENDPLEEIFALNMGDFVSEYLISEDLAKKIGKSAKDKTARLKSLPYLSRLRATQKGFHIQAFLPISDLCRYKGT